MWKLALLGASGAFILGSASPPPAPPPQFATDLRNLERFEVLTYDPSRSAALLLPQPGERGVTLELNDVSKSAPAEPAVPLNAGDPISSPPGAPILGEAVLVIPVRILVSLPQQKIYVFQGDELFGVSPISTGRRGHDTPIGTFPILQKKVKHRSNLYANAPMPYMQRLTHGGVALHAGHVPGYRASHGCIRLPWGFAKKLYGVTRMGTEVRITDEAPASTEEALGLV